VSYDFFKLDEFQEEAVSTAINEPVMILTGGPGTGKTTVCRNVIAQLKEDGYKDISLACPTGKAAKRLTEQVGRPASTIHRLLKYNPTLKRFEHGELYPLECQALILDEVSMVDIELFDHVLCACPRHPDFKLILVGDQDQLPSVGPGNILKDLIASERIPTIHLQKIHRQSPDSWISRNAARVNRGKELHLGDADDFFWIEREDQERAAGVIVALAAKAVPDKYGLDPLVDIQVLSPQRRGVLGTEKLNEQIQAAINPPGKKHVWKNLFGNPFVRGDKVIHVRNNYTLEVFNGETGVVVDVLYNDSKHGNLLVDFGDRKISYNKEQAGELRLSFALTIHKSQGSEYPCVIIPVHKSHHFMLSRSLLYTGITRGKQLVYLVGNAEGLKRAIKNNKVKRRYTTLCEKLKEQQPSNT
jgi:exodeoxyribonuclease V alpha subunit